MSSFSDDIEKGKAGVEVAMREVRPAPARFDTSLSRQATEDEKRITKMGYVWDFLRPKSLISRYLMYIIPVNIVLAIPLAIFATIGRNVTVGGSNNCKLFAVFAWIEILWTGFWVGKLCAKGFPTVFQFLCGMVTPRTRKWAMLIQKLELPVSIVVWTVLAFVAQPIIAAFGTSPPSYSFHFQDTWMQNFQRFLLATIAVSGVFLAQKVIIQGLAVNHHRKQYETRIRDMKNLVQYISQLYKRSIAKYPKFGDYVVFADLDQQINDRWKTSKFAPGLKSRNLTMVSDSAWTVFNTVLAEVSGGSNVVDECHVTVISALERHQTAKALAERLWRFLTDNKEQNFDANQILKCEDFENHFPGEEHVAQAIFHFLDKDHNGDLSWDEMRDKLVEIEKAQKDLDKTMHQIESALGALDKILGFAMLIAAALIYAAFFSANFFTHFTVMTTTVMSFSFAFAGTVQEFAGSCIFLFVKHPYDINDKVMINNVELTVRYISLLYTQFIRTDTNRILQIPNIVLNSDWIENVTRSGATKELIPLTVDPGTSSDDLKLLERELEQFVRRNDNKRSYQPNVSVDITSVGDFKTLNVQVTYGLKGGMATYSDHRNRFLTELVSTMRRIPIYAPGGSAAALGSASCPAYSVTVTHEHAQAEAAKHAEDLVAKKMARPREDSIAPEVDQGLYGSATGVDANRLGARQRLSSAAFLEANAAPRESFEI